MSGGVLPAVLINSSDGEGGSGQCVEFSRSELGSELGGGTTGPGDVAVVGGVDGDGVVGIEVVPGD